MLACYVCVLASERAYVRINGGVCMRIIIIYDSSFNATTIEFIFFYYYLYCLYNVESLKHDSVEVLTCTYPSLLRLACSNIVQGCEIPQH